MSTEVIATHCNSTQVHASPGQTKAQVDPSLQLASTCVSVWPGLKGLFTRVLTNLHGSTLVYTRPAELDEFLNGAVCKFWTFFFQVPNLHTLPLKNSFNSAGLV